MLTNHKTFDCKNAFWFSLIEKINKKLRIKDENIATITSIEGMLRVLVLYYTGLLPFFSIHDKVFGITVEEVTHCTYLLYVLYVLTICSYCLYLLYVFTVRSYYLYLLYVLPVSASTVCSLLTFFALNACLYAEYDIIKSV